MSEDRNQKLEQFFVSHSNAAKKFFGILPLDIGKEEFKVLRAAVLEHWAGHVNWEIALRTDASTDTRKKAADAILAAEAAVRSALGVEGK